MTALLNLPSVPATPDSPRRNRPHTHDEMVAAALAWEEATGVMPTEQDWNPAGRRRNVANMLTRVRQHIETLRRYDQGDYPSAYTIKKHFGSWNAFVHACGREPRSPGRPAIHTSEKPPTPNLEQVRRRVGEVDARTVVPRAYGRNVMARLVRAVLEADQAGDKESLQAILLDGAAELVAWADRLAAEQEGRLAA